MEKKNKIMKLILKTNELKKIVNKINQIVLDFDPISENTGILIEGFEDKITLKGRNNNLLIKSQILTNGADFGHFLIKSKTLNEAINKIQSDTVTITKNKNNSISLTTNALDFNLNLLSGNFVYYPLHLDQFSKLFKVNGELLKKAIKSVLFCASEKNPRVILKTINFKIENNTLNLIASDETKIGFNIMNIEEGQTKEFSLQLNIVKDLLKILDNDKVEFYYKDDQLIIKNDNDFIETTFLENSYPNVLKFFPKKFQKQIIISKEDLLTIFSQAMLINNIKSMDETPIKFSVENKQIILQTQDEGIGNILVRSKDFKAEIDEDFKILFNPKFLLETVKWINSKNVLLQFNDYDDPFIVCGEGEEHHKVLILPFGRG